MKLTLKASFLIVFILACMLTWFAPSIHSAYNRHRMREIKRYGEEYAETHLEALRDTDPRSYYRKLKTKHSMGKELTPSQAEYLLLHRR